MLPGWGVKSVCQHRKRSKVVRRAAEVIKRDPSVQELQVRGWVWCFRLGCKVCLFRSRASAGWRTGPASRAGGRAYAQVAHAPLAPHPLQAMPLPTALRPGSSALPASAHFPPSLVLHSCRQCRSPPLRAFALLPSPPQPSFPPPLSCIPASPAGNATPLRLSPGLLRHPHVSAAPRRPLRFLCR